MEILDAALDQSFESSQPTPDAVFESAALTSPEQTETATVKSEPLFNPSTNIVDEIVSPTGQPVQQTEAPKPVDLSLTPIIDAISQINTQPIVNVTTGGDVTTVNNQAVQPGITNSIETSINQINTETQNNQETVRLANEYSNELTQNYQLSIERRNSSIQSLLNLDTYLKNVSSNVSNNQQVGGTTIDSNSSINQLQTGITNVLSQREEIIAESNTESNVENAFTQINTSSDTVGRVENTTMFSPAQVNKLIRPENPVVSSIETMSQQFNQNLSEMNSALTTNMNNMKTGDSISTSTVNSFDQSSTINQLGSNDPVKTVEEQKTAAEQDSVKIFQALNQNAMYLSSIYELLAAGIKVKISY